MPMPGIPQYTSLDIAAAHQLLTWTRMSRGSLCQELGLGEGTVKSILTTLKKQGTISATRQGHFALRKPRIACQILKLSFAQEPACACKTKTDLQPLLARDRAIRAGATGALALHQLQPLQVPGDADFAKRQADDYDALRLCMPLKPGEWLFVCWAPTLGSALRGCFAGGGHYA